MKILKNVALILFVSLAFTACKKDDNNDDSGGEGGGAEEFTAKINGANFAASTDPASLIGGVLSNGNGLMVLTGQGSTNSGDFINFSIINYDGTGTYTTGDDLSNTNSIQYGELAGNSADVWGSNGVTSAVGGLEPGEINVTSQDDEGAEGTFSFEGYNGTDMSTKMITQGKFTVKFDN